MFSLNFMMALPGLQFDRYFLTTYTIFTPIIETAALIKQVDPEPTPQNAASDLDLLYLLLVQQLNQINRL